MADQLHYVPGDYYQLDDLSGFKIRASVSRRIPGGQTGGAVVDRKRWEPQQPQDFVRGVPDVQTVPVPRPRQPNRFVILATYVTAPSARLTLIMTIAEPSGFTVGDNVVVMLDSGENFATQIAAIDGNEFWLGTPLPATVGTYFGDPIENTVLYVSSGAAPPQTGLWNDGGTLALLQTGGYPTDPTGLAAGAVWNNGFAIAIVPGVTPDPTAPALTFGTITMGRLLFLGGGDLPTSLPAVAGELWNNGGEVAVA